MNKMTVFLLALALTTASLFANGEQDAATSGQQARVNKAWFGKWLLKDGSESLNIIESGNAYRLKMSFEAFGPYNFSVDNFYEEDGFLVYEINDPEHSRVYRIRLENGILSGTVTQYGQTKTVAYERISEIPEDGEFQRANRQNEIVPGADKSRIEILRQYAGYSNSADALSYEFGYPLGGTAPSILEEYNYSSYISKYSEVSDELAFALLDFVCDNFRHTPSASFFPTLEGVIHFSRANGNKTNCLGLSIMLAGMLRLNGIQATFISCEPYEEPFDDNHVVVDCLLPSGKRVMLDPTYRLYLFDKSGEYVTLRRFRQMLINGEEYTANKTAAYNNGAFDFVEYRDYMTKNTFRFARQVKTINGYVTENRDAIQLIPVGYPIDIFNEWTKSRFVYNEDEFWKL